MSLLDQTKEMISDTTITAQVKAKYLAEKSISVFDINVETNDGVVKLAGEVNDYNAIDKAIDIARQINGVKDVINHLTKAD